MTRILDGRAIGRDLRDEVAAAASELAASGARAPGLAVVLVGDDPASRVYVGNKRKAAAAAGFRSEVTELGAGASETEVRAALAGWNRDEGIDGVLLQLPLPRGLDADRLLSAIDPAKDVDGLTPESVGRLWLDRPGLTPATPTGIVEMLKRSGIEIEGRRAVVIGRSALVGKPMAALLLREQATVTLCHSRTRDLAAVSRGAEILVAALGKPAFVGPEHVAPGAVVVDVGIHRVTDPGEVERLYPGDEARRRTLAERGAILTGDVDFRRVAPRAGAITPVPGGVGPLTVATLLTTTLAACRRNQGLA